MPSGTEFPDPPPPPGSGRPGPKTLGTYWREDTVANDEANGQILTTMAVYPDRAAAPRCHFAFPWV